MHSPSIDGTSELRAWQFRVDPDKLISKLSQIGIQAEKIIFQSESDVEWLRKTTVIVLKK